MAEYADREHFIPLRTSELIDWVCADKGPGGTEPLGRADQDALRQFALLLTNHYHYEFHKQLERLKDAYAPFDPDADTRTLRPPTEEERAGHLDELFAEFDHLLEKANYTKLKTEQILAATEEASDWGVNMDVNLDCFERLEIYIRGDQIGKRTRRRALNLYRLETVSVPVYRRMVLILKQKPHRRLGRHADTRSVFLKVFKDIPKVDIEMLLPGTRLKMPKFELGKLGASVTGTVAFLGWKLSTLVTISALMTGSVWAIYGPASLILGYGYKQYYGYVQTRQSYTLKLTQSLYYQNLDSNAGVFYRLLDEAEEQECREALLGYYYLWRYAGSKGWTGSDLDDYIEMDLERRADLKVDFEIGDALGKLETLRLIEPVEGRYRAVPVARALDLLDTIWDNYFKYSGTTTAAESEPLRSPFAPASGERGRG